jgi:hypothetical protein
MMLTQSTLNSRHYPLNISPIIAFARNGIIKVKLTGAGRWYAKFINMVKIDDPKLNYESKWATLTFEIK